MEGKNKQRSKAQKRVVAVREGSSSKAVACCWHFFCLCIYIAIYWYDNKIVSECPEPGKYFEGNDKFGGRWKYLTYISWQLMLAYFFIALINDFFSFFSSFISWLFTSIIWPLAWVVTIFFWVLYAMDRESIYPTFLDDYLPLMINICWHVVLFPVVILEVLFIKHRYPSGFVAIMSMFCLGALYTMWTIVIHNQTGKWTYDFMKSFNYIGFCVFSLVSSFIGIFFYYIGRALAFWRWRQ